MSVLDLHEITALRARCLDLLQNRYLILHNYLNSLTEEDLLEIYVEVTTTGDWSTFEACKATIDARIKAYKDDTTKSGQIGTYLSKVGGWGLNLLGLGLPDKDFCDTYVNNPQDQQTLYGLFVEAKAAVERVEAALAETTEEA